MSREIDAQIGELLGWDKCGCSNPECDWWLTPDRSSYTATLPHFSTDIAAAWTVVAYLRQRFTEVEIRETQLSTPYTTVVVCGYDEVVADTTPAAICRAALKTVE